jgi:hypothetical protein
VGWGGLRGECVATRLCLGGCESPPHVHARAHEVALIPKGIKAGDLRWGCEGLDIWNSWGNYCVARKSVGSQTMNEDSSRSQHRELTASRTGGTDQPNAHSELRIQILVRANSAEKVPDTQQISCLDHHTRRCSQSKAM